MSRFEPSARWTYHTKTGELKKAP
ncbi:MAG: hypothetical protein RL669_900, partial [Pseudomonadota bacterium]